MNKPTFRSALSSSWALLLGFGILMLGDGLQGTLLAVRADQEGFSPTITGLVMSAFYMGFLGGSVLTPKIVAKVGHIRVFAALAALASTAILVHAIFLTVPVWIGLRLLSGFCLAGLYVVAESWLNDRAVNENRGKILSLYMIVSYLGVAIGQLLLNLGDTQDYPLFILTSILISIAVIPLLLSAGSPPEFEDSTNIKLVALFKICPFGSIGLFIESFISATFFSVGPVYAKRIGLDLEYISYFIASAMLGTVLLQWPIGLISDRFDRRTVIGVVTVLAAFAALGCSLIPDDSVFILLIAVGLFGGLFLPLYSLCIAYTNDRLDPSQMVAASGTLVLISGFGAILGPLSVAAIMEYIGIHFFFPSLCLALVVMAIFAVYRMKKRQTKKTGKHASVIPTSYHPSSSMLESAQQYARDEYEQDSTDQTENPVS